MNLMTASKEAATAAAPTTRREVLSDQNMELPRIDDRINTGHHRVTATVLKTGRRDLSMGDADTLGWYEDLTKKFTTWYAGDLAVGEQTYLPRPGR